MSDPEPAKNASDRRKFGSGVLWTLLFYVPATGGACYVAQLLRDNGEARLSAIALGSGIMAVLLWLLYWVSYKLFVFVRSRRTGYRGGKSHPA